LSEDLSKYYLDLGKGTDKEVTASKLNENLRGFFEDSKDAEGRPILSHMNKMKLALKEAEDHFRSKSQAEYNEFRRDTMPIRKTLTRIEKLKDRKITDKFTAMNLKGELDYIVQLQTMAGAIRGGLDRMNRKVIETHMLNGPIRDVIYKNKRVIGSKNILNVMEEGLAFYKREEIYDLFDRLEKDGLMGIAQDYIWNLIRNRINGFTPARLLEERVMKRVHYFGLVYDSDYDDGKDHMEDDEPGEHGQQTACDH